MPAKLTFFPVDNGDMTLITTDDGKNILIDCHIRSGTDYPDVVTMLTERLSRDDKERPYVDVFISSHPHDDHCKGIAEYFYLGKAEDYPEKSKKIFIREIWASPLVYKRANSTDNKLTDDPKALHAEIRRRIRLYEDSQKIQAIGDQVLILTADDDGKTDDIQGILYERGSYIEKINNKNSLNLKALVLGPAPQSDVEEEEIAFTANESSVILNIEIKGDNKTINFLTGGDAKVVCWDLLWKYLDESGRTDRLDYDLLLAPHHCSWGSLSHDSWSKKKEAGEVAKISIPARNALSQSRDGAFIVSSSKTVEDDDNDPPSYAAMLEYQSMLSKPQTNFICVADNIVDDEQRPLEFIIGDDGFTRCKSLSMSGAGRRSVNIKDDGRGYA